jgi:Kef-type K+ transport system membrane component KefB
MAAGIMLSQVGEFGFVLLALALHHGLLDQQLVSLLIGIGIISIAMTPWLVTQARLACTGLPSGRRPLARVRRTVGDWGLCASVKTSLWLARIWASAALRQACSKSAASVPAGTATWLMANKAPWASQPAIDIRTGSSPRTT